MIRDWVVKTIENDPGIFHLPLSAQVQALIVKPLNDAADQEEYWESPDRPKIVVIDGLDECGDIKSRLEVLHALLELRQLKIPLHLIITSRPEQRIQDIFHAGGLDSDLMTIALDANQPESTALPMIGSRTAGKI
ncbi:hypothetical protein BDZ97DRAFT_1967335 [Flammula alnicola]|nr:hypothetical protein BDZ97DRAFT_1967335 [Flammula alnicola]